MCRIWNFHNYILQYVAFRLAILHALGPTPLPRWLGPSGVRNNRDLVNRISPSLLHVQKLHILLWLSGIRSASCIRDFLANKEVNPNMVCHTTSDLNCSSKPFQVSWAPQTEKISLTLRRAVLTQFPIWMEKRCAYFLPGVRKPEIARSIFTPFPPLRGAFPSHGTCPDCKLASPK